MTWRAGLDRLQLPDATEGSDKTQTETQTDGRFTINMEKNVFRSFHSYVYFFCNLTFLGAVTAAGLQGEPQRPAIMTSLTLICVKRLTNKQKHPRPDFILKIYFNTTAAYKY